MATEAEETAEVASAGAARVGVVGQECPRARAGEGLAVVGMAKAAKEELLEVAESGEATSACPREQGAAAGSALVASEAGRRARAGCPG